MCYNLLLRFLIKCDSEACKKLTNEIMVRKYTDLKPFFEKKALQNQIMLNNIFLEKYDSALNKLSSEAVDVIDGLSKVSNTINYVNQAKAGKSKLEAILTPKMREALANGTAKLCNSHKDGEIFSKIQYSDGSSEFISLKEVKGMSNTSNMAILANQMQMQQTLKNIQDILTDFAEETDRQLMCLQRDNHDNRMIKAETAKLDFEEFLKSDSTDYKYLMHSINEAYPSICKEIKNNLGDLQEIASQIDKKTTSFGMKKMMEKEQILINYILEGLTHLQVLCNIEMYIDYSRNENKTMQEKELSMFEVQQKYSTVLIDCFSKDKLKLLSGLSIFPEDIWRNNFMPGLEKLNSNMKEALICQNNVKENTMEVV